MRMFAKMLAVFVCYPYVCHVSLTWTVMKGEILMSFAVTDNIEVSGCSCTVLYAFTYFSEMRA